MTLRANRSASTAFVASLIAICGCGSSNDASLFGGSSTPFQVPADGAAATTGASGGPTSFDDSGGSSSTGSFPSAGGAGDGASGTSGAGGVLDLVEPTAAGEGGDAGTRATDAGTFNPFACDYSGTWATYASVPVTWPATIAILAGGGNLNQVTLSRQVQTSPGTISTSTVPCAIAVPDFQTNLFGGASAFGIRFPSTIFDTGGVPAAKFTISAAPSPSGGFEFSSTPFAFTIGFKMDDPTTTAWPGASALVSVDQDGDQHPGVTILPATGTGYSYPPTSIPFFGTPLADLLYLAQRTVSTLSGSLTSCDELKGSVTIVTIAGVPAIDSSVIGCHVQNGDDCAASQAGFIDQNRPVFTPSRPGSMISVRVPDGATCADARARFPSQ